MSRTPAPAAPSLPPPGAVRLLTALVLLEAVGLVAAAVATVVVLVRGSSMPGPVLFMLALALGVAALLAGAGRGLLRGDRWGRSPVMTVQILLVVLAIGWLGVEVQLWAVGVLALAAVTAVVLLLPPVTAWTTGPQPAA
ncbi:hypothetical protein [Cellulomonas hominis]|uniref:hypothetical protein n=1 Tax=Cellulomonas hominis TaxID=156981 RepID=UPI0020BDD6BC|nr:hypothetical protein [Cellulomonas hominis]